jgi:hypothetical protein
MASNKLYVDLNLNSNELVNLKADTLDITTNLASANAKRIVYYNGQYYYSDGTSWVNLGNNSLPTGGVTGDILAKASGTNYDVEWISNYTSTVQHEVKAGVALTKGQAVYVSSADGTNMIVSKASNASEATSSKTMGLVASSAALNGIIFVITEGLLTGTGGAPLNTSTANAGDPVWLGTNGNLIFGLANKPVAPAHLVFIGIVTRSSATVGEIFVKVQNGYELGELHDVDALNASNNDGLFYNTSNSLWEHKSIATVLGYTPANSTFTINTSSPLNGSSDLSGIGMTLSIAQASGSTAGYLSSANWTTFNNKIGLTSLTANTPLSYNNSTGVFSIPAANTIVNGYLSFGDFNTFNNKIGGSGTTNYVSKFTAGGTIGNSIIQDDGSKVGINIAPQTGTILSVAAGAETAITATTSASNKNAVYGSNIGDTTGNRTAAFFESYPSDTPVNTNVYVGARFYADGPFAYAVQLQDNSVGIGKFLKSVTSDGKANWATMSVADTGLTLTTTGTNGAATLVGNTLNIPTYESSLIPKLQGNETYRGSTYRNNSTTVDTTSGYTITVAGTAVARAITGSSFSVRSIRMGVTASVVATGRYSGLNGPGQQFILSAGFMFVGEFNISDTAFATGTHNFWGLAGYVGSLNIGDLGNAQPSALLNTIAFANDSGDGNLQFMYNDGSGVATKIDLGSSFPSNRTAGAAITTIYSCYIYNAPASTSIIYRIVNKETGAVAQGTVSSNLPATNVGLNFYGVRTMGTSGGGVTNSGQFDVYRFGIYSL